MRGVSVHPLPSTIMCKLINADFQHPKQFLQWYKDSNSKLDLKPCLDLAESVEAGLLLHRIIFFICSKKIRQLDVTSVDWASECRLSNEQVKVSLTKLKSRGLIELSGTSISICGEKFLARLNKVTQEKYEAKWVNKKTKYSDSVTRIFDSWKEETNHPFAVLGPKDKEKIVARLREGFTEERMIMAIKGCKLHPFYNGTDTANNPKGIIYDRLDIIYKDTGRTEHLINIYENGKHIRTDVFDSGVRVIPKTLAQERRINNFEQGLEYARELRERANRITETTVIH